MLCKRRAQSRADGDILVLSVSSFTSFLEDNDQWRVGWIHYINYSDYDQLHNYINNLVHISSMPQIGGHVESHRIDL